MFNNLKDPVKSHFPKKRTTAGFALVLSLLLMAFALLLLLSMQALLRIEISSAAISVSHQKAQQNAVLGLQIALGELQKYTGVDTVVTARAELLDSTDDTALIDNVANPFWTGVWKNDGTLLTWLVSGNSGADPLYQMADSTVLPPSSKNVAALVSEKTVTVTTGIASQAYVHAPKQAISNNSTESGNFAFWIGDEGVKSKVNLAIQSRTDLLDSKKLALVSAQHNGVNAMTALENFPLNTPAVINRLSSRTQLDTLTTSTTLVSALHFHDLTIHSYGILSNTAMGGLKKDLTAGLANTATTPDGSMFPPISEHSSSTGLSLSDAIDPGGPLWEQLRSWVNYPSNTSGELLVRPTSDRQTGLFPVITGAQFFTRLTYETDAVGMTGDYYVHIIPAVVLWNPYNVPLVTEDYTLRLAKNLRNGSSFTYLTQATGIFQIELQTGESSFEDASVGNSADYNLRKNGQTHLVFHIPNVSLAPGEAMVYSPPVTSGQYHYSFNYTTTPSASENQLAPGFNMGGSFYLKANNRTLYPDIINGDYYKSFAPRILTSNVLSVRLSKGMGQFAETDVLSEALYLSTGTPATPAPLTMSAFNAATPFSDLEVAEYFGFKAIRTFVDTVSTTSPMDRTRKWLANYNPRARMQGTSPYEFAMPSAHYRRNSNNNPSFRTGIETSGTYAEVETLDGTSAFVGLSESLSVGAINRTILYEVPESLDWIHSIGQLMHAPLYRYLDSGFSPSDDRELTEYLNRYARFDNLTPAYAIGNSLANPHIPLDELYVNWADLSPSSSSYFGFEGLLYDYSYLLNEALWDRYYFSTVPTTSSIPTTLPNSRMVSASELGLTYSSAADMHDINQASAGLMINGAFNVNSASIEAWKALFASFYGLDVSPTNGSSYNSDLNNPESPILRLNNPVGNAYRGYENSTTPEVFDGYRILTPQQITDLAEAMVQQIKARGPFTSLASFVNRSIHGTSDAHKLHGALQAAINASGINSELEDFPTTASNVTGMQALTEAGWATEAAPGALTQADVLARLGATLSPRSDTFRIRAYGESINTTTGAPDSKAWCEAIVQRIPDFVDAQANVAWTPLNDTQATLEGLPPLSTTNKTFGRDYRIIKFRWLLADEI
ncbi:MAG: hypothetical protein ACJAU9_000016 [Lentimonas sp.]